MITYIYINFIAITFLILTIAWPSAISHSAVACFYKRIILAITKSLWRNTLSNNNNPVGIVIHINEVLQQEQINKLENSLGSDAGVKEARINRDRSHFMVVDYMPSVVTARQVINYVKNRGYNAVLVGG